jgi:hypothetical protein
LRRRSAALPEAAQEVLAGEDVRVSERRRDRSERQDDIFIAGSVDPECSKAQRRDAEQAKLRPACRVS